MEKRDGTEIVKERIRTHTKEQIVFTKSRLLHWLCERNKTTLEEMKEELVNLKSLVFAEKQEVTHEGRKEERYRCYFVYSRGRGRCYVLHFAEQLKVITVFPLGKTTLRRYRKRFK